MRNCLCRKSLLQPLSVAVASALVLSAFQATKADITITPPVAGRVVVGSTTTTVFQLSNPDPIFAFSATVTPSLPFSFLSSNGVPVTAPAGGTLSSVFPATSSASVISTGVLPGAAGDLVSVGLTVTPDGGTSITSTAQYRLLQNRVLSGSVDLGDAGRYMLQNAPIRTIIISGGTLDNDHATSDSFGANANGYLAINGFEITNPTAFTYNGSNQTHDFQIQRTSAGKYALSNFAATSGNFFTQGFAAPEAVNGAKLDFSGVTVTAAGDALLNRSIASGYAYAGRFMQAGPETSVTVNSDVALSSFADDDYYTRLQLSAFNVTQGGLTASMVANKIFDSGTAAIAHVQGTTALNKTNIGLIYNNVSIGSKISSLENLPGETPQNVLNAGVSYNILNDNAVTADTVNVFTCEPDLSGYTFANWSVGMIYDTTAHTNLYLDNTFKLPGSASRTITITAASGGIVGEGLAGEHDQASFSYQANVVNVAHAIVGGTPSGAILTDHSTLSISNLASRTGPSAYLGTTLYSSGNASLFMLGGEPITSIIDGHVSSYFDVFDINAGGSINLPVSINTNLLPVLPAGSLGVTYRAYVTAYMYESYGFTNGMNAASLPGDGAHSARLFGAKAYSSTWTLEKTIPGTGNGADTGSAVLAPGSSLGDQGITLTSQRSTTASLIDSEKLPAQTTVTLSFTDPKTAGSGMQSASGFGGIKGDIVTISGLDGILHVAELTYPDPENPAFNIDWYDAADGAWINAVLGNHNISLLNLTAGTMDVFGAPTVIDDYLANERHNQSYGAYLLSVSGTPELGAFGMDASTHSVWAVIDHNSSFAAVPEPTGLALLAFAACTTFERRRRLRRL